ncbi:MAG: alginate lyase family protein, partial [Arcicella sp.]|nr:alginate lyase family protein [Arcicella sp.]
MVKRIVFFLFCISIGITNALSKNSNPFLLELNLKTLQKNKADIEKGDISKKKALEGFLKTVEKIVENGKLYSVTHKKQVPPSGDKHDYMSMGPYWWPDPTKPNGLPYIRKDGQVNPEYHDITDTEELDDMAADVEFL